MKTFNIYFINFQLGVWLAAFHGKDQSGTPTAILD
jgi:hypothetical protein